MLCLFMKFFRFGKKGKVLDLTERYKKQQAKMNHVKDVSQDSSSQNSLGFLGDFAQVGSSNSQEDERKKKLTKRLMEITNKMEDLSNQIYHLQQRVEVLEKKIK
jgi:septal ring factor EnvC (AmiA/AmiB activator)